MPDKRERSYFLLPAASAVVPVKRFRANDRDPQSGGPQSERHCRAYSRGLPRARVSGRELLEGLAVPSSPVPLGVKQLMLPSQAVHK